MATVYVTEQSDMTFAVYVADLGDTEGVNDRLFSWNKRPAFDCERITRADAQRAARWYARKLATRLKADVIEDKL